MEDVWHTTLAKWSFNPQRDRDPQVENDYYKKSGKQAFDGVLSEPAELSTAKLALLLAWRKIYGSGHQDGRWLRQVGCLTDKHLIYSELLMHVAFHVCLWHQSSGIFFPMTIPILVLYPRRLEFVCLQVCIRCWKLYVLWEVGVGGGGLPEFFVLIVTDSIDCTFNFKYSRIAVHLSIDLRNLALG